ncbi:MAG: cob(I)yrinic acid a,c-diamide adenosyltransferase [Candidatus Cloacimonetes bacterium]|nr:cob(I)yrinic acid a,c-diamide adenosyltransferase [Candidatus Cloacimonadota bacterium]
MIQIYTGNGKGKTTAALGMCLRALGQGYRVCIIQFMKKNHDCGEIKLLENIPGVDLFQFGTAELVDPVNPAEVDFEEAGKAWIKSGEAIRSGRYDLIVLDEINVAVKWKLLSLEKQLRLLDIQTKSEIVMTGRYAAPEIIARADLVTEMKEIKHYFHCGIPARKGIEY